jgi:putative DNA modification/repair radical SAM protein
LIGKVPSTLEKIRILGANSKYDICASTASSRTDKYPKLFGDSKKWIGATASAGICHSYTPDGRCMSLFKTLYTNKCIYNCKYCFSNNCKQRVSFTPEEYARTFMKLYSMNVVEGIFLTSGVCGSADDTTEEMLEAVRLLRYKYNFQGYIHFKCLPGLSQHLLKDAICLSDRISINSEASTKEHLAEIAEQKDFKNDIMTRQRWLKQIRIKHNEVTLKIMKDMKQDKHDHQFGYQEKMIKDRREDGYKKFRWDGAPILNSGQTTQYVVGAAEHETDWDLLKRVDWQYRQIDLRRAYFSSFIPIEGTPFANKNAAPLAREHRLYQTDWLLRIYHYKLNDIKEVLTEEGYLPQGDPKLHFARQYFKEHGLVDPNQASYQELLRVPGIGPISAKRIINLRAQKFEFKCREDLKSIGVVLKRADPFLKINGRNQTTLLSFCDPEDNKITQGEI